MRFYVILASTIFAVASAFAQNPTPQQVQQAKQVIQSGTPVTPEMIDAAKSQVPGLDKLTNEQIQQQVDAEKKSGSEDKSSGATEASPPKFDGGAATENNDSPWMSKRGGGGGRGGLPGASRFPGGLERFGADFFRNADVAGLGANTPALPDYLLSPGDEILVSTWGRENRNAAVVIDNEGMFHYPPLAPVRIAGLRFDAAQKTITSEIQKIHGVTASVSLGRLRNIRVMVLGEAARPGSYNLPAGATTVSALVRSGGVTGIGSLRSIQVRRNGKTIATLDLYDMLLKGASKGDVQLLSGDALFVPLAGPLVAVHGMVKRPAIYEIKGSMRSLEALDLAGGLNSSAFKGRVRIDRVQGNKRNIVLDVDMNAAGDAKSNVRLDDGDVLFVDQVLNRVDDVVYLEGNVNRPGRFQYKPGMTVRDLVPSLKDLKAETFFEYAHIARPAADDDRPTMLSFSLADVFQKNARVPLQPRDVVMIYSRYDVVERPTVSIGGTVRRPGKFGYSEGMRVSDLIILGGGLGDAYLVEAHLVRALPGTPGDSSYSELIKVNIGEALEDPTGPANLELAPFDRLQVFPRSTFMNGRAVAIYGAVRGEGEYEITEGMGLPELVILAGGLTKNSYKLGVEVARRKIEKDSVMTREIIKLSLKDVLDGNQAFTLQDGDGVYIREVVNASERTSIVLGGEFAFPGRYEFSPGEKLSSVIKRAGGFTKEAYLRGAVYLRPSVRSQQMRHAEEIGRRLEGQLQARLQQTTQEAERQGILLAMNRREQLLGEISRAPYLGRVVIKLDKDMDFADTDWDLELEDGDNLTIGPRVSTVSVLGEVSSPTTVVFTRKTNQVGELLDRAGGVNTYGDYKETFYIGPDGSISTPRSMAWYSSFKCKNVEPGGTVIVPLKPPRKDYLEIAAQATQILYQLAITVGVAATLF